MRRQNSLGLPSPVALGVGERASVSLSGRSGCSVCDRLESGTRCSSFGEDGKKGSYGEWLLKPTGFGGLEWRVDMLAYVNQSRDDFFHPWLLFSLDCRKKLRRKDASLASVACWGFLSLSWMKGGRKEDWAKRESEEESCWRFVGNALRSAHGPHMKCESSR